MKEILKFQIDYDRHVITVRGKNKRLGTKPWEMLLALLEAKGGLLTRDALAMRLNTQSPAEVNQAAAKVRQALGKRSVECVHGYGYRINR